MRPRFFIIAFLTILAQVSTGQAETLAIVGGTIIDGNGGKPIRNGVIVIDQQRITAMGTKKNTPIPQNSRIIPAEGKYIIPGLMDANVHLILALSPEYTLRFEDQFEDIVKESAQLTLRNGVTTVFDSWGPLQPLKTVRDQIRTGEIIGSRIFLAGNIVGLDGPLSADFDNFNIQGMSQKTINRINAMWQQGVGRELMYLSPDQVRTSIRDYLTKDIDFLKYAVSGHGGHPDNMGFLVFSPQAQQVIVEEGRKAGMVVQTHTTTVESVRLAAEANVDIMQHCGITIRELIPESTIQMMVKQNIACSFNISTQRYLRNLVGDNITRDPLSISDPFYRLLLVSHTNQMNMIKAGVTVLLSTDGANWYQDSPVLENSPFYSSEDFVYSLGTGHFVWLKAAIEKGLSPMQALQSATRNIARAYKVDKDLGTLEPGKIADLVILDKNPLEDVEHYRDIKMVLKEGIIIDHDSLPESPILSQ